MLRVVVVVPCFNEEKRLDTAAFRNFCAEGYELLFRFVNDGSRDGTLALIESLRDADPARFRVTNLEQNSGKAEAVRRGFLDAIEHDGADLIGFWDADLATPLDQLPFFLAIFAERQEIRIVMGARVRLLGRDIRRRPSRHYFGRVGATLISSSLGLAVYDTQCGAKLFRNGPDLAEIFGRPFLSRWIFDVEIIARAVQKWGRDVAARSIYELPIAVWHDVGGSKVKSRDFVRALRDLRKIHRAYNARK